MYKLTVIAGPNRGSTFSVSEGETGIGRQTGNVIVLASAKVSKRHASLYVQGSEVVVQDLGSSNGTFVNGVLVKSRKVQAGDRISVGEFVLELVKPQIKTKVPAASVPSFQNVIPFPQSDSPAFTPAPGGGYGSMAPQVQVSDAPSGPPAMPSELPEKLKWIFEYRAMPFFYGFVLKNEWKMVIIGLAAVLVLGSLYLTMSPVLNEAKESVVKEMQLRARVIARQVVERNSAAISAKAYTKTELGSLEREYNVQAVMLIDMDSQIILPASRMGQKYVEGTGAKAAVKAMQLFISGEEKGRLFEYSEQETVVAVEPMKVFDSRAGKNVVVGMAVVTIDTSVAIPALGEIGVKYAQSLVFVAILALVIFAVMYRITLKPFEVLNDDIDRVLRGEMAHVTHEFKFEEMNSLWEIINSALQRAAKSSSSGQSSHVDGAGVEEFSGPLQMVGKAAIFGMIVLDGNRRILSMNDTMQEISGIRAEQAIGSDINSVARDQSFGAMANDLFDRSMPGSEGVSDDFDFSGVGFKLMSAALGATGGQVKGYIMCALKKEG